MGEIDWQKDGEKVVQLDLVQFYTTQPLNPHPAQNRVNYVFPHLDIDKIRFIFAIWITIYDRR